MKISFLLGTAIALVCIIDAAVAQTPAEVKTIAQAVTVEINLTQAKSIGSGILIHKQGNLYTLITNRHVVCGEKSSCSNPAPTETFQLKFGNGSSLKVPASAAKILGKDIDLAIVQFKSNSNLQTALIAPSGSLKVGDRVYTSGYPVEPPGFSFNTGEAIAVVNKRLTEDRGGYTVVYNAETQSGMSGGGVFDKNGRIVAIHGQGERFQENTELPEVSESGTSNNRNEVGSKIGYNRGIPVRWVVQSLAQQGIRLGDRNPVTPAPAAITNTADEYFIAGFNKLVEPGNDVRSGKWQAIEAFGQAIRLNPRYKLTYFLRAISYFQLNEYRLSLADFNQAIALNSKYAPAYYNRAILKKDKLNDPQGALADSNQAIALNPKFAHAYYNRGLLKQDKLNDSQGALADYNQGIALNPKFAHAYNNRAILKQYKLNDPQGALADYNQAIVLNPKFALAYYNRGLLKTNKLNDPSQGALADYNQAIALNPKFAPAYYNRGLLKANKLNDLQGALADYNQAIALNPKFVLAYNNRALLKANKLNDLQGALADYNQVIALNPKFAPAYYNRANLKQDKLNDFQGALADYNQAIALNPKYVLAYNNRGLLKANKLNDSKGALADYNQAIALNPQLANPYGARGILKYTKSNDRSGGIADMQQAAELAKAQGNTKLLNLALKQLQSWGVSKRDRGF